MFPAHFDGRRFFNPGAPEALGFKDVIRWKMTTRPDPSPRWISDVEPSIPPRSLSGNAVRITLVNHSTVLIQAGGLNLLTDPIWSQRASPVGFAGPRRHRAPGIRWEDLPEIHAVLLSHNHYDHLDLPTLRRLGLKNRPASIAPLGVAKLLKGHGMGPIHELDWGAQTVIHGCEIHSVPAFHFSARALFDRNRTLWCGYMIRVPGALVYFAGDTAFGDHFRQIRERFGPPRVALLPIGAYRPIWFMSPVHMSPQEAVRAHEVLGPEMSIGIHHGTFQLADDSLDDPARALEAIGPRDGSFRALRNGEFAELEA